MPSKPIRLFRRDQMLDFELHLLPGRSMKWRTAVGSVSAAKVLSSGGGELLIEDSSCRRMKIYLEQVALVEAPEATYVLRALQGRGTL